MRRMRRTASVPAMTFGHLTHTPSANTRVGRAGWTFRLLPRRRHRPPAIERARAAIDNVTGTSSGAPLAFGGPTMIRTTVKANSRPLSAGWFGAPITSGGSGGQFERGENDSVSVHSDRRRGSSTPMGSSSRSSPVRPPIRRQFCHRRGVRQRRHHAGGPRDDQCRPAVRPQPRDQSGPARS